ncbi:MAG: hypothetical protein RIB84_23795 [Sneathiellaceae bacterium]
MEELRGEVDRFLDRHAMPASRLGKAAVNDANLVFDLRRERAITVPKADRVRAYLRGFDDGVAHGHASTAPDPADPDPAAPDPTAPDPAAQVPGAAEGADPAGEGQPGRAAARECAEAAGEGAGQQQGVGR